MLPCLMLHVPLTLQLVQSTASSVEDNKSELSMRSHTTQGGGEVGEMSDVDGQVVWNKATPLPTPEEKMRLAAQAVPTDIVPINVTGMLKLSFISKYLISVSLQEQMSQSCSSIP